MRGWLVLGAMAALCACHRQPDFDETYRQHQDQAMLAASSMEQELQTRLDASSAAGRGVSATP